MTSRRRIASKEVIPRGQAAHNEEDVAEAEVILNYDYGQVLGCPSCSTVYWLGANEWREICTECGSAVLWDADVQLVQREAALKRGLRPVLESLAGKWRAEARARKLVAQVRPKILFGGIAPGPFVWYLNEQYCATFRYGRRLTHDEAQQRITALCQQQEAAAEAQRRSQYELGAALAFLSISNQLSNIEHNQHRGY